MIARNEAGQGVLSAVQLSEAAECIRSYLIGLDKPYPELTLADVMSRHVLVSDRWPPRTLTVAEVAEAINELGATGCLPTASEIADRRSSERSEKERQAVIAAAKEAGIAAFDAAYHAKLEAAGIDPTEQEPWPGGGAFFRVMVPTPNSCSGIYIYG